MSYAGERLGPYEIVELIGKGGMGEVLSRPRHTVEPRCRGQSFHFAIH